MKNIYIKTISKPTIKKNPFLRKGIPALAMPIFKLADRNPNGSKTQIILVNSLPKSGTHLLLQIAEAFEEKYNIGRFITSQGSVTLKPKANTKILQKINQCCTNEIVSAHIHYAKELQLHLDKIDALKLFIYRDPRDVVLSEINYLTTMNKWHRMHTSFRDCEDFDARLQLALGGKDARYPAANQRYLRFSGWLSDDRTISVRYEDLCSTRREETINRIIQQAANLTNSSAIADMSEILQSIDPTRSHTFSGGGTNKWQKLTSNRIDILNQNLAPSLEAYGYPI